MRTITSAFTLIYLICASPAPAFAISLGAFQKEMQRFVKTQPGKRETGIVVKVLGKPETLFAHQPNSLLYPASNSKLITSVVALDRLGPGYTFKTEVYRQDDSLVLRGNGDPYLVSERLWLLARDVARKGVKKVKSVKVDNSAYEKNYMGLMDWGDRSEPFTAIVSPTAVNFNSLEIHVVPNAEGGGAKVELGPVSHGYATVVNEVKQVDGGTKELSARLTTGNGGNKLIVSGRIGRNAGPAIVYVPAQDSEAYLASVFSALLRKEGVEVVSDYEAGGAKKDSETLVAQASSLPLKDLARLLNAYSNNFMSEAVFLGLSQLSGKASVSRSRDVIKDFFAQKKICESGVIANGSGLSWETRLPASCFIDLLQSTYGNFRIFADLLGGLPAGGEVGTLKGRFRRTGPDFDPLKVRAKTGTLWSKKAVTSLVGFTQAASGEMLAFAILQNDDRNDPGLISGMRDWEDRCVELMQQLRL